MARKVRRKSPTNWWLIVAIVVPVMIVVGVIMANVIVGPAVKGMSEGFEQGQRMADELATKPAATLAEFNQLQTGMTYKQVCQIIGSSGVLASEVSMAGYHTVMYQWDGYGQLGANMNAMFQNGRLVSKAQAGLE